MSNMNDPSTGRPREAHGGPDAPDYDDLLDCPECNVGKMVSLRVHYHTHGYTIEEYECDNCKWLATTESQDENCD